MKGYKDSTKTVYLTGKSPGPKGAAKAAQTMKSFKKGEAPMKKAEGGRVKVIARGDIPGYDDKSTMKYRKEGPGWRMDPEEFRVMREIDARDRADIEKGKSANASKLDKMAGKEATERQNRRGWATEGFDEDTGIGGVARDSGLETKMLQRAAAVIGFSHCSALHPEGSQSW